MAKEQEDERGSEETRDQRVWEGGGGGGLKFGKMSIITNTYRLSDVKKRGKYLDEKGVRSRISRVGCAIGRRVSQGVP